MDVKQLPDDKPQHVQRSVESAQQSAPDRIAGTLIR
jgi:hypothetical protein